MPASIRTRSGVTNSREWEWATDGAAMAVVGQITVDMGQPRFKWDEIPLERFVEDTSSLELAVGPTNDPIVQGPSAVNVGTPNIVFWVDDVKRIPLDKVGPLLEMHPMFKDRVNVNIAQVVSRRSLILRTWEKGAGLTSHCGSAACAAVVCGVKKGLLDRHVIVATPGGERFVVQWLQNDHVWLTAREEEILDVKQLFGSPDFSDHLAGIVQKVAKQSASRMPLGNSQDSVAPGSVNISRAVFSIGQKPNGNSSELAGEEISWRDFYFDEVFDSVIVTMDGKGKYNKIIDDLGNAARKMLLEFGLSEKATASAVRTLLQGVSRELGVEMKRGRGRPRIERAVSDVPSGQRAKGELMRVLEVYAPDAAEKRRIRERLKKRRQRERIKKASQPT